MLIYAYKMILVAPSLTLSEQKLVLYFIFCFDVDDTSKYIYVGAFCTKKGLTGSIMKQIFTKVIYYYK